MKATARSYTVFFAGELFSLKHLAGNAALAAAIEEASGGRFRCRLPQDSAGLRGRPGREIRDSSLRALAESDLALFNFDGTDLDSGTVVEFVYAKFADIPSVLLRTDLRNAGDHRQEPWNLMAGHFPRTVSVIAPGLFEYRGALRKGARDGSAIGPDDSLGAVKAVTARVAARCVRALERVASMKPVLPAELRAAAYAWLPRAAGLAGQPAALRREFARLLAAKRGRGLL